MCIKKEDITAKRVINIIYIILEAVLVGSLVFIFYKANKNNLFGVYGTIGFLIFFLWVNALLIITFIMSLSKRDSILSPLLVKRLTGLLGVVVVSIVIIIVLYCFRLFFFT